MVVKKSPKTVKKPISKPKKQESLTKPNSVASNPTKSQIWDELMQLRAFKPEEIPALTLLCQWRAIADQLMAAMERDDGSFDTTMTVDLKRASSEVRALHLHLGLYKDGQPLPEARVKETPLYVLQQKRANGQSGAANKKRA